MALEHYSGPDLGFEEELPWKLTVPSERGPGSVPSFEEDVAEFLQARLDILDKDIATKPLTGDIVQIDCIPRDPFAGKYLHWRSIRDAGYSVYFQDSRLNGEPFPFFVDIYVSDDDEEAVNQLFDRCERPPEHRLSPPLHTLFYGEGWNVHAHYLDSDSEYGQDVREDLSPNYRPHQVDLLLTRQFLTSRVRDQVRDMTSIDPAISYGHHTNDLVMYRYLRQKGFTPFSPAELYDMAAATTVHVLANNPDIPAPAAKRLQQPEEN